MADHKKKHRGQYRKHGDHQQKKQQQQVEVDESSPIIQMFRGFQKELDSRHDKHERIVKLSRDITIESKRTIFLLHRHCNRGTGDNEDPLKEAGEKLTAIETGKFQEIAKELVNEDPHQFIRAFSPGLQEYIEALSFYKYLQDQSLIPLADIQKRLTFQPSAQVNVDTTTESKDTAPSQNETEEKQADTISVVTPYPNIISVVIPRDEYILGIADLTGELMRRAINMVGSGDLEQPYKICTFLQEMEAACNSLNTSYRELQRKMYTLRQSLRKVETACYTLKVRGSEIPKHMLVDMLSTVNVSQFMSEPSMEDAD